MLFLILTGISSSKAQQSLPPDSALNSSQQPSLKEQTALTSRNRPSTSPVDIDDEKPEQPRLHFYDKHGEPLETPVYFLSELDTVTTANPRPTYPLLHGINLGLNFADAILMLTGQRHAAFDLHSDISLYNWFFPTLELGIGFADSEPKDANYHYVGKPAFYTKIGIDYNFLYKSSPDYKVLLGLRGGFSRFNYDITDIKVTVPYWQQSSTANIYNETATAWYGEAVAGLRVKIVKNFALGWSVAYHFKFNKPKAANSIPWFIPGYGTTSPVRLSFSLFYTIPINSKPLQISLPEAIKNENSGL